MNDILIATRNVGKLREFERLLNGLNIKLHPLSDFPDLDEVEETGKTFEDNAIKKATENAKATGHIAVADDSGLMVDALGGRPGVISSRYAGNDASDNDNVRKVLTELKGVPLEKRGAAFVCVLAVSDSSGRSLTVKGICSGRIALEPVGERGFGYDPIFYLPELGCTMAEVTADVKNSISHRGAAIKKLKKVLPEFLRQL